MGGRAAKAAKYLDDLCKAICRGLVNQQKYDRSHRVCTGGLSAGSLSSRLQSVNEGGAEHVKPPAGHVNIPWSERSKTITTFPEHWIDSKHEPEGAGRLLIVADDVEGKRSCGSLHTGFNVWEDTLRREMNTIIEKYSGCVECWDDVSNIS